MRGNRRWWIPISPPFFKSKTLDLKATLSAESAYGSADVIIIATPTNYDPDTKSFDTGSVDAVVAAVAACNSSAIIVIKSTVPVGHTEKLAARFNDRVILFSPEFLREGQALQDNLYPSRIIVGGPSASCQVFSEILRSVAVTPDVDVLVMSSSEAEAVKLFANTYLAMRVSFFNELDSYALTHDLDTEGYHSRRVSRRAHWLRLQPTHHSVMVVIVCRRTRNNCLRITIRFRKP